MTKSGNAAWNLRVYAATLQLHDYLWFSSHDIAGVSSSEAVIHNYALTYAINRFERVISWNTGPQYEADLAKMALYCTPARASDVAKVAITYNAVDERSQRTDANQTINTPMLGQRRVIMPFVRRRLTAQQVSFSFYLFTPPDVVLPRIVRLGKKRALVGLQYRELSSGHLFRTTGEPTHLVNPTDVSGTLKSFLPISVPPNLVLDHVLIENDWFFVAGRETVHVPKRLLEDWIAT